MNFLPKCRAGDIAVFKINAYGEFRGIEYIAKTGTFVRVIGLNWRESARRRCWYWRIEKFRCPSIDGLKIAIANGATDSVLRPIRPGDGEDEMLRIAGKPKERDATLTPKPQVEHSR